MACPSRLALLAAIATALGCSGADSPPAPDASVPEDPAFVPPKDACAAPSLDHPTVFPECNTGGGVFGTWIVDDLGLPAYLYGLDQNRDTRARYFNTEGKDLRAHWAQFGTGRLTALASNDGYVEVTHQDRGETYLDKFDEDQKHFAGGYGYLDDGTETWCTAYKWRPPGSKTKRVFGATYAETTMDYRGVRSTRRTFAPPGEEPFVVDEVTLENTSDAKISLAHYEVWNVARRPIEIDWIVSGSAFSGVPETVREARDARNAMFDERVGWDDEARVLSLRRSLGPHSKAPPPDAPSPIDYYPADPFVAVLAGDATDLFTDQATFFGAGGIAAPDAVTARSKGDGIAGGDIGPARSGKGQPRMLTVRSDVALAAGEKKTLRFAFGAVEMGAKVVIDPKLRDPGRDVRADGAAELTPHLVYFATEEQPYLHRELAWHMAMLEAARGRRAYWNGRVVPQGSAYLFLHGADGAARDLSLFSIPLVYADPALARDELAMNMMITYPDDRGISYAFQGNGVLDDALGFHAKPSDLAIFLLFALSEYVGATGDEAFLDAPMPFYPLDAVPGATVFDHLKGAVRYLFDTVGTGPHGLVRLSTGDWDDGIALLAPDHDLAVAKGESVPNTQMAAAILPRVADLVEARDGALATEIRAQAASLGAAAQATWTGSFYGRAYFGDGKLVDAQDVNLQAQVWALIGDKFAAKGDRAKLVAAVRAKLDDPSPAGAALAAKGQVWPAIASLLTWGYAAHDADLAFRQLGRGTMRAHALSFPEVWYGIWDGPDGLNGPAGDRPGEAWFSAATPMTDFPVTNANQHAMPLLAALRVAGLEATATGLRLDPHVPGRRFSLRTALADVDQRGASLSGAYRPLGFPRKLEIRAPQGSVIASAKLDGDEVTVAPGSTSVTLDIEKAVRFAVTTSP